MKNHLLQRIKSKETPVGIIGLGYVGLPLAIRFAEEGFSVVGFDMDSVKVTSLNRGSSYIKHIPSSVLGALTSKGLIKATNNFDELKDVEVVIICVPTPLNKNREPDISFIKSAAVAIIPHLRPGKIVSLESTTYPGTTNEILLPLLESTGLRVGTDFFLVFSPEREDPGNGKFNTQNIPKVCGGITTNCLEVGVAVYRSVIDTVVPVATTRIAEMAKLLENIHRAVNIGLVNELKVVCDAMGIDIRDVIDAAATKPFGFTPYFPGPGLGGHCIPIDPFYLTWKAREYGLNARFIELAGEVNTAMPEWVIGKVMDALNQQRKPLMGARILVLGISYKKNIEDVRESPSVELMEKLRNKGAHVEYSDPHVPIFPKFLHCKFELRSVEITPGNVNSYDCILVATDHDLFDYELIRVNSKLVVDTRGIYRQKSDNIVSA
jgi:UDP-N-acetyl-D-glucosamine dehydrogenase